MAPDLENALQARSNALAELAALVASKPSYSKGNQSVQWQQLYDGLMKRVKDINDVIASLDGPWENITRGVG